jgi:hypothetical protein
MQKPCPKCSTPLTYQAALNFGESKIADYFLAYFLGDVFGAIVTALLVGVLVFVGSNKFEVAVNLGGVAGTIAYFVIFRRRKSQPAPEPRPGLFYCAKCQYYYPEQKVVGDTSAT